jgi:TolA-binding protein
MKKLVYFLIPIFIYSVISTGNQTEIDQAKELFETAVTQFKNNNLKNACENFEELVNHYSKTDFSRQAYFYLGQIYTKFTEENVKSSINYFNKSSLLYSGSDMSKRALLEMAKVYTNSNQFDKADSIYKTLLKSYPKDLETEFIYFNLTEKAETPEEKISILKSYIDNHEYSPNSHTAKLDLLDAYIKSGDINSAQSLLRNHLDERKVDESVLSDYYLLTGNSPKAEELLIKNKNFDTLIDYYKSSHDYISLGALYKKLLQNKDFVNWKNVLKSVEFFILNNEKQTAKSILDEHKNLFSSPDSEPFFFFHSANIAFSQSSFFLDETGARYIKDTNNYKEAREYYTKLISLYPKHQLSAVAALKIIEIEKEHLFDWENMQKVARNLIRENRNSKEALIAKKIMDDYRFRY